MLPVLENAQQTTLAVKRLETENCQLKSTIEQHNVDARSQGNAASMIVVRFFKISTRPTGFL